MKHHRGEVSESVLADVLDVWASTPGSVTVVLTSPDGYRYRVETAVANAPQRGARMWLRVRRGVAELS
jgi:hypothetical protein